MPQVPSEIELDRATALRVRWADGLLGILPLVNLRRACPCATCRAEREERSRAVLPQARNMSGRQEMWRVEAIEPVGSYAIRITWGDGHQTGIYDFEMLRRWAEEAATGAGGAAATSSP